MKLFKVTHTTYSYIYAEDLDEILIDNNQINIEELISLDQVPKRQHYILPLNSDEYELGNIKSFLETNKPV